MTESFVLRNGVRKVIYDAVLDWSTVPSDWFPPLGWRSSERRIAGWAHSALATDAEGMALVLADRGYFAEVVPPAADDAFVEAENVADVDRKPRALYFGSVRPEVDVRALVALRSSGVDVDVVGPVADSDLRTQLVEAGIKVGVPIGVAELACLAATYRVIVLPYRGERASTLMPAKFWNCVATGAWVVCKDLETPRLPTVRTTHSTEDFVTAVLEALDTPVEQSRSESPTWHTRWRRMLAIAGEVPREGPDNL
ncbi:MAG: hypothetical protein IPO80_02570 [Propionibacteriaceae bacterium]|nr:hypothetical protein [Propionibacteriaceae bacterium]